MKFRMASLLPHFLALLLTGLLSISASAASAPDLKLDGLDGKSYPLGDYIGKGKWVVVNIWGPRCPPCVEEMPELQQLHDAHRDKNLIVVGIAVDFPSFGQAKPAEVKKFVEDHFISFPILLGSEAIVPKLGAGPLLGTPTTLIYRPDGQLVARQVGQVTKKMIEDYVTGYEARQAAPKPAAKP